MCHRHCHEKTTERGTAHSALLPASNNDNDVCGVAWLELSDCRLQNAWVIFNHGSCHLYCRHVTIHVQTAHTTLIWGRTTTRHCAWLSPPLSLSPFFLSHSTCCLYVPHQKLGVSSRLDTPSLGATRTLGVREASENPQQGWRVPGTNMLPLGPAHENFYLNSKGTALHI